MSTRRDVSRKKSHRYRSHKKLHRHESRKGSPKLLKRLSNIHRPRIISTRKVYNPILTKNTKKNKTFKEFKKNLSNYGKCNCKKNCKCRRIKGGSVLSNYMSQIVDIPFNAIDTIGDGIARGSEILSKYADYSPFPPELPSKAWDSFNGINRNLSGRVDTSVYKQY